MSFGQKRVKRHVERMGYVLLVQRERSEGGKKAVRFRSEGTFQNRGEAEFYADRYFPNAPRRVEGLKTDFTPIAFESSQQRRGGRDQ